MTNPVAVVPAGVSNATGAPAISKFPGVARARTTSGPLTLQSDVMQFTASHNIGNWLIGSARVRANGISVIHQASIGSSISQTLPPGPMTVGFGDARVKAI